MFNINLTFLFLLISPLSVNSTKILIFSPGYTNGECSLFTRLSNLLTDAGNIVTLFRPQFNSDLIRHKLHDGIKEIKYEIPSNGTSYRNWTEEISKEVYHSPNSNIFAWISHVINGKQKFALDGCEKQLSDPELFQHLKKSNFELAIINADDLCAFGMVNILGIPTYIALTSASLTSWTAWATGVPSEPSSVPNTLTPFHDRMVLRERIQNIGAAVITSGLIRKIIIEPTNELFRKYYGNEFPDLSQLIKDTPLIFVNDEEMISLPRPILHKIIYIGGFSSDQPEPVSDFWREILDNSKDGIILISFGTTITTSSMPMEWKNSILNLCKAFPSYTFILKHDEPKLVSNEITNLKIAPWLPQERILAHPKTKAFISGGGVDSISESSKHGVPMLIIPLFIENTRNTVAAARAGVAIILKKTDVATGLVESMKQILMNDSYTTNAKLLGRMINSKPIKPAQLIVGWTEFLAQFKSIPNLQPASGHLSLLQYLLVDAFLVILLLIIMTSYLIYRLCYCYYWRCFETSFHDKYD